MEKLEQISIYTKKTGAGHYSIEVMRSTELIGKFETTDMQLIDDIHEMKNDGFEHELCMHDSFDEVVETVLNRMEKTKTFIVVYTSQEDCGCNCSHDTAIIEEFDTIEECLSEIESNFEGYEAHEHSVTKSAEIQIEGDDKIKSYVLANVVWNYNIQEWGEIELTKFDKDTPDDEWEV